MRIRRNAFKLLGSASAAAAAAAAAAAYTNPSPAPAGTAAAEPEEEFTVCELNRSPWDVMDMNLCNFFTNPKEEENGGILGNFFKTEVKEPITAVASTAAELTLKELKEIESKRVERKERKKVCKGRKETILVAETETATYCKKSDGKGWHCKRLAQLPSSLCSYHLAQIRSYSSNHSHRAAEASAAATGNGKNLHAKPAAVGESTGVASNFYYYYNGFGPWRSKRRSGKGGVNGTCVKVMEDVKEDRMESVNHDDDDNVVAGDDEYDLDCFDEDDDDDDNLYSMPQENEDNGKKKEGETEKKKVLKKRGRKPFKCRSLKSLL